MSSNEGVELTLGDYLTILRRRWFWVLLPSLVVPALAVALSTTQPEEFDATSEVLVASTEAQASLEGNSNSFVANRDLTNDINLSKSNQVIDQLEAQFGEQIELEATAVADADVLEFTVTAATPHDAALVANTWAEIFIERKQSDAEQSFQVTADRLRVRLAELRDDRAVLVGPLTDKQDLLLEKSNELAIAEQEALDGQDDQALAALTPLRSDVQQATADVARTETSIEPELNLIDAQINAIANSIAALDTGGQLAATGTARFVQVAQPPLAPSNAPLSRNLGLGLVVGGILGVGTALVVDNLDTKIRDVESLELAGHTVLGAIPRFGRTMKRPELVVLNDPNGAQAAGYQKVRAALQFSLMDGNTRSIMITSPNQAEGKTTTATNMALAMAQVGRRAVLADVDFRRPRVASAVQVEPAPGLTDAVLFDLDLAEVAHRVSGVDLLAVITAGTKPANPADFVSSAPFGAVIEKLCTESDILLIDAAPVLPVADAVSVARQVDAAIVVVRADKTTWDELDRCLRSLKHVHTRVLGLVLIGSTGDAVYYGRYEQDSA